MPHTDRTDLTARATQILGRRPAVGLALGVVRDGSLEFLHTHGVADIATGAPVTGDTVFRIASISKTVTGVAVMQLYERGLVDLDVPAAEYLRAYRLVPARPGFRPPTVRHLLTHTAGLGELAHVSGLLHWPEFGESVPAGRPVPTLAEFYRGRLPVHAEPGSRFIYGNHSFATLGQIVADVSGQPLDGYLREHVFDPLGMTRTDLVRSPRVASGLATGYDLRRGGAVPVADFEMITAGAAAVYSTPADMARYVAALLGGGANGHGTVLKPDTVADMFAPQYRPDPRIAGFGLAFFRGDAGGHPVIEHQGVMSGFTSQVFLAPADGIGVIAFTNGARGGMFWLPAETAGLLHHLLGVPEPAVRTDVPQRPDLWAGLCGWYRLAAGTTDVRTRAAVGAGIEVFVRGGRLMLRGLTPVPAVYRGLPLHPDDPDDPYVFRIGLPGFGAGGIRVVFGRDPAAVHLEVMPLSAYRRPAATNPRRWVTGGLAAAVAAAAVGRAARRRPGREAAGRGHRDRA